MFGMLGEVFTMRAACQPGKHTGAPARRCAHRSQRQAIRCRRARRHYASIDFSRCRDARVAAHFAAGFVRLRRSSAVMLTPSAAMPSSDRCPPRPYRSSSTFRSPPSVSSPHLAFPAPPRYATRRRLPVDRRAASAARQAVLYATSRDTMPCAEAKDAPYAPAPICLCARRHERRHAVALARRARAAAFAVLPMSMHRADTA